MIRIPANSVGVVLATVVTLFSINALDVWAQSATSTEYGPAIGSLIIDGGNPSLEVQRKFIELGGGVENGRFVVIPTGAGIHDADGNPRQYDEADVVRPWIALGVKHVRMLHTANREEADTESFIEPLLNATGVWLWGGRQWRYVDAYSGTLTLEALHNVLGRGGVIAGGSAGATIQGEYLVRGDTRGAEIMMTDEADHQHGFSFLRRSAIDQHINTRNRWDDLIPVIQRFPNLLGIGLSEGTAIVVTGDTFEVIGVWKVAVHDNSRPYQPWEKPYFVLSPGDVYDMKARAVVSWGNGTGCPATPSPTGWISVSNDILDTYVGEYDSLTVFRDGLKLYARSPAGTSELVPLSSTEFVLEEIGATVRFRHDQVGKVSGLMIRRNCNDRHYSRVP